MKKYFVIFLSLCFLVSCEGEDTDITGIVSIDSITPSPGSILPELGEKVTFTFENIQWKQKNKDEGEEDDIVAWFVEATNSEGDVSKVGWHIFTTTEESGIETITQEVSSWNHTTFTKKPTTLSVAVCKSKELVGEVVKTCSEIAVTEIYEYQ